MTAETEEDEEEAQKEREEEKDTEEEEDKKVRRTMRWKTGRHGVGKEGNRPSDRLPLWAPRATLSAPPLPLWRHP